MSEDLKRAGYMPVQNGKENPILIVTNCIRPKIEKYSRKFPKYKKIGKEAKIKLIKLVSSGYPIINASEKLQINYSTAKSIIQKQKRKRKNAHGYISTASDQSYFGEQKNSSLLPFDTINFK